MLTMAIPDVEISAVHCFHSSLYYILFIRQMAPTFMFQKVGSLGDMFGMKGSRVLKL